MFRNFALIVLAVAIAFALLHLSTRHEPLRHRVVTVWPVSENVVYACPMTPDQIYTQFQIEKGH